MCHLQGIVHGKGRKSLEHSFLDFVWDNSFNLNWDLDNLEITALPAPRPVGRKDMESGISFDGKMTRVRKPILLEKN